MSEMKFVISRNPPGFVDGLQESVGFGRRLRGSLPQDDRAAFESTLNREGVPKNNFRQWINGEYFMPAIQAAWNGWQGKSVV